MTEQDQRIAQRYAGRSRWPLVFLGIAATLVVLLVGWLVWAVWVHATPQVSSKLTRWQVVDQHTASATVDVRLESGARDARCLLRAYAEDHTVVGDAAFTPTDGTNEVTVRTERRATSVESIGCTADGQNDAR